MLDNEVLRKKIHRELKRLDLDESKEAIMIKELNYLSSLLIEVYVKETQHKI